MQYPVHKRGGGVNYLLLYVAVWNKYDLQEMQKRISAFALWIAQIRPLLSTFVLLVACPAYQGEREML